MSRAQIWDGSAWVDMGASGDGTIKALVLIDEYEADGGLCDFIDIPDDCHGLKVVANLRSNSSADTWEDMYIRLGDGSVDTSSVYYSERQWGSSSGDSVTTYWMQPSGASPGNAADDQLALLEIDIAPSYSDASMDTMAHWSGGRYDTQDTADRITRGFGSYMVNNVVDRIRLGPLNGSGWEAGTVKLYGYREVRMAFNPPAPVAAGIRMTADQTIATATYTTIDFDGVDFDDGEFWDSGDPERITFHEAGRYILAMSPILFNHSSGLRIARLIRNGSATNLLSVHSAAPVNGTNQRMAFTAIIEAEAGDYVQLQMYQSSGGNLAVIGAGTLGDDAQTTRIQVAAL